VRRLPAESGSALRNLGRTVEHDAPKTVTAARLLADQGHVALAREVLGAVLARTPGDAQATELFRRLRDRADGAREADPAEEALAPPVSAEAGAIAAAFRRELGAPRGTRERKLERLRVLLAVVERTRRDAAR